MDDLRIAAQEAGHKAFREVPCGLRDAVTAAINAALDAIGPEPVIAEIATERRRQIDIEGWSLEHDDLHTAGHMAYAAGCYAIGSVTEGKAGMITSYWPWHKSWWKSGNRRRMLIKAAALIVAEIERLDRAALRDAARGAGG